MPAAEYFGTYIRELPNYFNIEHINYFTLNTLDTLLGRYGFLRLTDDKDSIAAINPLTPEAIISAVYKKDSSYHLQELIHDNTGYDSVNRWLTKQTVFQEDVDKLIIKLLSSDCMYVVWGTGNYATYLLTMFPELLDRILCFVDNNSERWGERLSGKSICSPQEVLDKNVHILICSMLSAKVIAEQVKDMGLDYTVISSNDAQIK